MVNIIFFVLDSLRLYNMYSMLDEDDFVVMLNDTFICITSDYDEAKEFYEKQVANWKEIYKDKSIDNNDKLVFKDYGEDRIIAQFSKMDLL